MNTEPTDTALYRLIRDYMALMGTSRTTLVALQSYINAVSKVDCAEAYFKPLVLTLNNVIKNAEPKVVSLCHLIEEFESEIAPHFNGSLEQIKTKAIDILTRKLKRFETDTAKLTEQCAQCIQSGDFIIASSPTGYIRNAFVIAHTDLKQSFRILVLKEDFPRTRELVKTLDLHKIPYDLIPQYNLGHFLDAATKLFISAVSITSDNQAVTGFGTANVVDICHAHQVPVYLFVESLKFSHTPLSGQHIHKEKKARLESDFVFHVTTFSNDFIELGKVDHLITERGTI